MYRILAVAKLREAMIPVVACRVSAVSLSMSGLLAESRCSLRKVSMILIRGWL